MNKDGKTARTFSKDMQYGHAYILLETLAFPLAEWILNLEPGFQCGAAKGRKKR
jgi:hypothetical protein